MGVFALSANRALAGLTLLARLHHAGELGTPTAILRVALRDAMLAQRLVLRLGRSATANERFGVWSVEVSRGKEGNSDARL